MLHTQNLLEVQFCFSFPTFFFLANSIYLSVQSAGLIVTLSSSLSALTRRIEEVSLSLSPYLSPSIGIGRIGEGWGAREDREREKEEQ